MIESKIYDFSSYTEDINIDNNLIECLGFCGRKINVCPLIFLFDNEKIPNNKLEKVNEGDIIIFNERFCYYLVIKYKHNYEFYQKNNTFLNMINKHNHNNTINDLCLLKFVYEENNETTLIPVEGMHFDIDYLNIDECDGQMIDLHLLKNIFDDNILDFSNEQFNYERLIIKRMNGLAIYDSNKSIDDDFKHISDVLLPIMKIEHQVNNITHIKNVLKNLEDRITVDNSITISSFIQKSIDDKASKIKSISKMKKNELVDYIQQLLQTNEKQQNNIRSLEEEINSKNNIIDKMIKEKNNNNIKNLEHFLNFKKSINTNIDNICSIIKNSHE